MKKIISVFLTAALIFSTVPVSSIAAGELKWEDRESTFKATGQEWQFRPPVQYVSEQNPPDFSWPKVNGASGYELVVCRDEQMTDIAYENRNLDRHYYNFSVAFEPGVYYWSVRYKMDGKFSEWTKSSRFIITPDAPAFTVDDIDTMLKKLPKSHPRIVLNQDNLPAFREMVKGAGKDMYDAYRAQVDNDLKSPIPEEPTDVDSLRSVCMGYMYLIQRLGIVWLAEQDPEVGKFGVEALMKLTEWDPNGVASYANQDQAFRDIIKGLTFGYDFLYDLMTADQRKKVLDALQTRIITLEHPTDGLVGDAAYRLEESPFMSHGFTAIHYLIEAGFAAYGDLPEAEAYLRKYLPMYINILPPWGNEDGGWSQGVGYAGVSLFEESNIVYTLYTNGMTNMYNKAFLRNMYRYPLYNLGLSTGALWGDGSTGKTDGNWSIVLNMIAQSEQSGYMKWLMEKFGSSLMLYFSNLYLNMFQAPESKAPVDLPRSAYFKDIGWVSMHSDLTDINGRTSLYFKSSPYGSHNHSHNDQNGFTVSAYGESLAINSGYYDAMWSDYYNNYYKKTYAHNCITMDGGVGQAPNAKGANGDIVNYLTHPNFDLASGDATVAYNLKTDMTTGVVSEDVKADKMKRHIIYVRPDSFIVIDDLKRNNGEKSSFEWWLNASDNISLYESKTGARITKGRAALDVKVQYPQDIKASYADIFSGPDLVAFAPSGSYLNEKVHKKVWFSTQPAEQTKIVTTMSTHKTDEEAPYVKSAMEGNVNKLEFEDGTVAYVRTDEAGKIEIEGIESDGLAVVRKKDSYMVVDATVFQVDGKEILRSDKPVSITWGDNELGVSAYEDAQIELSIGQVDSIKNEKTTVIERNNGAYGFSWDNTENGITANVYKGFYSFYLNGKPLPGTEANDVMLSYEMDGVSKEITMKGYYNHDGETVLSGSLGNEAGFYTVEEIRDVNLRSGAKAGELLMLSNDETVYAEGAQPYLKLKSAAGGEKLEVEKIDNPEEFRKKCSVIVEAENFYEKSGGGVPYTTRSFLSGGAGLTEFNTFGDSMSWKIKVPKTGDYDLVMKYVGWDGADGAIQRLFQINGVVGTAYLPATNNYGQSESEWIASRVKAKIHLEEGENILTLYPQMGSWNFDWIGLVPSNE